MKKLLLLLLIFSPCLIIKGQKYGLTSPDGRLTAGIEIDNGIYLALLSGRTTLIKAGNISFETYYVAPDIPDFRVRSASTRTVSETVFPQIREKAEAFSNNYNELEIRLRGNYSVTFRLFNEGIAYRFSYSLKDSLKIVNENLDLYFEQGDSVWFQSSETFSSPYETPYEHKDINDIGKGRLCNLPVLIEKQNGTFIMITESDLYDYPGMWLAGTCKEQLSAVHPKYPEKLTGSRSEYNRNQVEQTRDYIAWVNGTRSFPWRIFAIADNEKELVDNNMVYLLASPSVIEDVSWIKPGVVMFDWWAKHNIFGVDFKAGINTETAKYFIDFCAKYGFRYFMFDDGWSPENDLLTTVPGLDMDEVTSYAREKGVDILLWMIWHTLERQWDEAFDLFQKWGIKGIKVDFMNRDDQWMVSFYEKMASEAAARKMIVDFHGAYKPCGLSRKYPNVLTREGLIEFEYNGWTDHDNPLHHNLLPYIRMFTGSMDYIPATMRNASRENFRPIGDYPMGQGTRAHAMALFVILSSPLTMLPDSPSDYYREEECTGFLAGIPVVWDETKFIEGNLGKYTVIARRSGPEWYVGAITDWDERDLDLDTDFLEPGKYRLEAIEDGLNANKRAEDYRKTEIEFTAGDVLKLHLASGGGWIAHIVPLKDR